MRDKYITHLTNLRLSNYRELDKLADDDLAHIYDFTKHLEKHARKLDHHECPSRST